MPKKIKGGDATRWKTHGVDREDNSQWFRTADPKADAWAYGKELAVGMFATSANPGVVNKGDDA